MAGGLVLLVVYGLLSLLHGVSCQDSVVEQPLRCFQSSSDCSDSVNETILPYSQCCGSGTEHFMINSTCYACDQLLSFSASSFSVLEGARFIGLRVERVVNPGTNIFFFSTVINDITATAGVDYGQFPDSGVGFINVMLKGESEVHAGIVIIDDSVVEYNETFNVSLVALSRDYEPLGGSMDSAVVTIIDDDKVDISIQPSGPRIVNETATSLSYTLNRTGESVRDVEVQIDLSDLELVFRPFGPDWKNVTFKPSVFHYDFMVDVVDDDIVEATEDHVISLRVPEGETGVNLLQDSATIVVEDEGDFVEIGFSMSELTVSEEDGSFIVNIVKTGSNERPVVVRVYTSISQSAEGGFDFSAIDMLVEFAEDENLKSIEVNVSSDGIVENVESFVIALEVPESEPSVLLTLNTINIKLEDTRFVIFVEVDKPSLSVREGENVTLTLSATGAILSRDLIVEINPRSDDDIAVSPLTVVFSPGQQEKNITITAVDDPYYEGPESGDITVNSDDPAVRAVPLPIPVDIEDNDSPQLEFSEAVYVFNENQTTGEIVVNFGAQTESPHSWNLTSVPLTATEGEDYSAINTKLTFDNNIREHSVEFQIHNDNASEGLETFELELRNVEDIQTVTARSLVEIVDDENLIISFVGSSFTVNEGENLFFLEVNKSGVTTTDITVEIVFTDVTATGGVDYGFFPTSVFEALTLILADETAVHYPLLIREDDIIENVESINATLQLRDTAGGTIKLGDITKATIFIEDNDKLPVFLTGGGDGVVSEEASVAERTLEFTVSRDENATLDRDVVVTLSTTDGSAKAARGDYVPVDETFTFTPTGRNSFDASVFVEDDQTVEATEDFFVDLTGDSAAELPENATVIYITDDDEIQVDFSAAEYTVNEGSGVAIVFLTKTGLNEIPVMVSVVTMTQDDTAIAGVDYNATIQPVEFQMIETEIPLIIPIIDDNILENTESFTVILAVTGNDSNVVLGPRDRTTIIIIDDDNVTVEFSEADYSGTEGDIVAVEVVLSNPIDRTVSVMVDAIPGTATEEDYDIRSASLDFSPGQTSQILSVSLDDDDICDDPEEAFMLSLSSSDPSVLVGSITETTITITDDDECLLGFMNSSDVDVDEPEDSPTPLTLCVELTGKVGKDVSFAAVAEELLDQPVENQALRGQDFIFEPMIFTLRPSENIVCFDVSILSDDRDEDVEVFRVRILPDEDELIVSRAEVMVSINAQNITTDPPLNISAVEFSTSVYTVAERDGVVNIPLVVSPPLRNTFASVLFSTSDGTAMAPGDYESQTNTSITVTEDGANVSVIIMMGDRVENSDESFFVSLSLPDMFIPRIMLGDQDEATVIITADPEPLEVQFSADVYSVAESDGMVTISLRVSPAPSSGIIDAVLFSTIDGTAIAPDDYVSQTNTRVPITSSRVTVSVEIVMDDEDEETESFTVSLSLPILAGGVIILGRDTATVSIIDSGAILVDDTVTGDPFFVVPLSLAPNSTELEGGRPSLCYEIHGAAGSSFNLISDTCTSVNAFYSTSSVNPELNFISEIGVKAVDLDGECVTVNVSVDNDCVPSIYLGDEHVLSMPRYNNAGVVIRQSGKSVRISVPNCANTQLVMWIKCREVNQQPQLRFDITRGLNLNPTSHGLLGQFWNIPVRVTPYELRGPNPFDLDEENLYLVEVLRPGDLSVVREFVAEFYPLSWDHNRPEPCLYAGDQQGGRMVEFRGTDPVIENNYRLYRTDDLFDTEFRFSMFQSALCEG